MFWSSSSMFRPCFSSVPDDIWDSSQASHSSLQTPGYGSKIFLSSPAFSTAEELGQGYYKRRGKKGVTRPVQCYPHYETWEDSWIIIIIIVRFLLQQFVLRFSLKYLPMRSCKKREKRKQSGKDYWILIKATPATLQRRRKAACQVSSVKLDTRMWGSESPCPPQIVKSRLQIWY